MFGTLVHEVLESVDPGSADLAADLRRICGTVLAGAHPVSCRPNSSPTRSCWPCERPLVRSPVGRRLCDIPAVDRLAELGFELPLAGGEHTSANIRLGDLAPLLRRHLAPDGPLASYADLLDHPALAEQSLRGYLTGSIDAVLRVREPDAPPRYLVVDYKTNWLGTVDGPELRLSDYTPDRMGRAMKSAHYPLQALLYLVAVHRMLRWRQPDYQPEITSAARSTSSSVAWPGRTRPRSTARRAACSAGSRRSIWWWSVPTCWTGDGDERHALRARGAAVRADSRSAFRLPGGRRARTGRRPHRPGPRPDRR